MRTNGDDVCCCILYWMKGPVLMQTWLMYLLFKQVQSEKWWNYVHKSYTYTLYIHVYVPVHILIYKWLQVWQWKFISTMWITLQIKEIWELDDSLNNKKCNIYSKIFLHIHHFSSVLWWLHACIFRMVDITSKIMYTTMWLHLNIHWSNTLYTAGYCYTLLRKLLCTLPSFILFHFTTMYWSLSGRWCSWYFPRTWSRMW